MKMQLGKNTIVLHLNQEYYLLMRHCICQYLSVYINLYPVMSTEKETKTKLVVMTMPCTPIANLKYHFPLQGPGLLGQMADFRAGNVTDEPKTS